MNANRILYRTRQFWQALGATPASEDLDLVRAVLTPAELALFKRLQTSEKAHSIRVLRALLDQSEEHPDLLTAALLHDVGKSRFPLKLWQRVLIVVVNAFFSGLAERWGRVPDDKSFLADRQGLSSRTVIQSLRRPFIVANKHPEWGAEMAAAAGASPLAVAIIKRHQEEKISVKQNSSLEERLLSKLQSVDDNT